ERLHRHFPATLPLDAMDFLLGAGWAMGSAAALGAFFAAGRWRRLGIFACIGQIAIVAFSGLLKCETARVWIFLMPLLAVAAGAELAAWPPRWRWVYFASAWLGVFAVAQNITFISP